ncbi:MAG TPA: EamA family transporter [Anaerolineales bacterium]
MFKNPSSHRVAVLQALFVTLLWSTSWVLIKIGLEDIPALTFAGLRYSLAFASLLPFLLHPARRGSLRSIAPSLPRTAWVNLLLLGLLYYTLTQGTQFIGLAYLPAVTVSLLLNFSPVVVALLSIGLLSERPTARQWLGVGFSVAGTVLYFFPVALPAGQTLGLFAVIVGMLANAFSTILGSSINRSEGFSPLAVTTISMGFGAVLLLSVALLVEGLPQIGLRSWGIIAWLAVVNTALAFTLWNQTLRTLSAVESSVINNTMLVQIAVLAWIFLGEHLTVRELAGLVLAGLGTLIVQLQTRLRPR